MRRLDCAVTQSGSPFSLAATVVDPDGGYRRDLASSASASDGLGHRTVREPHSSNRSRQARPRRAAACPCLPERVMWTGDYRRLRWSSGLPGTAPAEFELRRSRHHFTMDLTVSKPPRPVPAPMVSIEAPIRRTMASRIRNTHTTRPAVAISDRARRVRSSLSSTQHNAPSGRGSGQFVGLADRCGRTV